jgi:4'-phosphopantetheinyl transferase
VIIDIYQCCLVVSSAKVRASETVLSEDECGRFNRMISPWRERSIIARASLRFHLAQRLGIEPQDVSFDYGEHEKPRLSQKWGGHITFNLAHSAEIAVIAIGNGVHIGIDLEEMKNEVEHDLLAGSIFSFRELTVFRKMPLDRRRRAFFYAWTRKEAFVKATGEGMSRPLSTFEVAFENEGAARMSMVPPEWASTPWSLIDFATAPGFTGALAVGSGRVMVQYHDSP